ncbi:MAG: metallophosphoesterase family protein [Armatimonadota bacterium]
MVRFVHTADLQLGMRAGDASEAGEQLREARFDALQRIVDLARDEEVDFIVIAGDMFEHNQVASRTVSRAVQILQETAPIRVFVLPGNHDWYDAGSVYQRREFSEDQARNITVLSKPEPMQVSDTCTLYPCPVTERWSYLDPTAWIPEREEDEPIRIGVAHGTLPIASEERILPIEPDVAQHKGLDYIALGHTHGLRRYESARMAYPGTPEQTSFGEEAAGHALIVTVEPGRPPEIEERRTGSLTWLTLERKVNEPVGEALDGLRSEVETLEDGPHTLLRLRVDGTVSADSLPLLGEFAEWLDARRDNGQLLHVELEREIGTSEELAGALRALADQDEVIAGAIADLRSLAAPEEAAPDNVAGISPRDRGVLTEDWLATDPPEGEVLSSADVASEALHLLARISGEVN